MNNLKRDLLEAYQSDSKYSALLKVLEEAKCRGISRQEAVEVVRALHDELPDIPAPNGKTSDYDILIEIGMIVLNNCQPQYRIWTEE